MRRPDPHMVAALRTFAASPDNGSDLTVVDSPEARVLGLVPYTARPMRDQSMNQPEPAQCAHEDTKFVCPFCAGHVDADTHLCARCREAVAPVRECVHCGDDVTAFWPYAKAWALAHPKDFPDVVA